MKRGFLSEYFSGVGVKRLSAVEAQPERSNQHEFNGTAEFREILGDARRSLRAKLIYLTDEEDDRLIVDTDLTWYDAREAHPTRTEYRLYFRETPVSDKFAEGDLLVIGLRPDGSAVVVVAEQGSTAENQLLWLFGVSPPTEGFSFASFDPKAGTKIGHLASLILEQIGVEADPPLREDLLPSLLARFGSAFPPTKEFSSFARDTLAGVSPKEDPDGAVIAWMDHEEGLFRALERHIVADRLKQGFGSSGEDVDEFLGFSLSVQNRRKSRAGYALENHLETIFLAQPLSFSRGQRTERTSRPDFIFPGIDQYRDPSFSEANLSMLAVKSTLKDRWRQILVEADRIGEKHLFTLEPGLSSNQTDEIAAQSVQLVLPQDLHKSLSPKQLKGVVNLNQFIQIIGARETTSRS